MLNVHYHSYSKTNSEQVVLLKQIRMEDFGVQLEQIPKEIMLVGKVSGVIVVVNARIRKCISIKKSV
jgi:hypothetical protein